MSLSNFISIAQSWKWAINAGGIYSDKATDMAIDSSGNLFVSGYYNVGQPASTLSNFGSIVAPAGTWGKEGFLAKVTPGGTWSMINAAVGGWDERVLGVHTDNVNGFVYATGCTWTWNPNDFFSFGNCGAFNNPGMSDEIFLGKFDFNGNCQWVIGAGSDGDDHGYDMVTDKAGNIYLTGFLSDHYGWFGNPGYFGSLTAPMTSDSTAYVTKISPAGVFLWVKTFEAVEGERDNRIAIDTAGDIYITGGFWGTKLIGSTSLTSFGGHDIFVTKLDGNGNFIFAAQAGSPLDDRGNSITVDTYGDIYITGEFRDKAAFGTDTINNNGGPNGRDIFVAKMKSNGNWVWAKKAGSVNSGETGDRIISNKKGQLFVTGQFKGNAAFGTSITLTATTADSIQVFVAAIDTGGKWHWALAGGGALEDRGNGLACDDSCNLYNCGYYDLGATFGSTTLPGLGKKDLYVAKISNACFSNMNISSTNAVCGGQCNGTATAIVTGGIGPLTYSWNTSPVQTTQTASGLCIGNYIATAIDSLGNIFTESVLITEPSALTVNTNTIINASCNLLCNGSATLTVSGGSPGYTYSWSTVPVQTNASAVNLCAGSYTCTITDTHSCTTTQTVNITEPPAITSSINSTNVVCNSQCNGMSAVTISGSSVGFTYSWSTIPVQISTNVNGLCAGNYTCTITDPSGCTKIETTTITQPAPITITSSVTPITCSGSSNGAAHITVSGGTNPYAVSWNTNPVQTGDSAVNLSPGLYAATITDINNCIITNSFVITDTPPVDSLAIIGNYCSKDPTVLLHAPNGGVSPDIIGSPYQWYSNNNPINGASNNFYTVNSSSTNGYSVTWYYHGCRYITTTFQGTIYQDISDLPQTNIFSPNDDQLNDDFLPFSLEPPAANVTKQQLSDAIEDYELTIYDRWGKLLFSTNQVLSTWNGNDKNGDSVPAGTYYWIAKYKARCTANNTVQKIKGFVQLIR